ncbi:MULTISPECIES: hypothetical protein [Sphingomonas]|nr:MULTISPECIES: hypothetical protein [Sphingomonas]
MRLVAIMVAGATVLMLASAAHAPIQAFGRIEPGQWQLRALDNSAPVRRLCVADAYDLVQLRHPGAACSRFVLANEPQTATVHYTCAGAGYGRTTIRVETPQLVRIESQGLANQSPFQVTLEGRRLGKCEPEHAAR